MTAIVFMGLLLGAGALIALGIKWSERRSGLVHDAWRREQGADIAETAAWFSREADDKRALYDDLRAVPWPELRRRCEEATGVPCCCSSRVDVVQRMWAARLRNRPSAKAST